MTIRLLEFQADHDHRQPAIGAGYSRFARDATRIYPPQMAGELKPRQADISIVRMHDVLEHLFAEHRVARLWHRYLLPSDVRKVRTKWLDRLQRHADQLSATALIS